MITPGTAPNDAQFSSIAAFVLSDPLDVPEDVLRFASTLLIDTLGVAAGAVAMEPGRIARDFAVDFQAAGPGGCAAALLFDGREAGLPGAIWALATQIDNLDGHDGYNPTKGHIGCAVVPALMGFAAQTPDLSGRDALVALAMSYEVAARAGIALHASASDYHTSGAWNALGVAALGARLRGSGAAVLREALGIAEYHGPRSQMMREIDNPTMLHDGSGMGALVGAQALLMAERGFTGAPAITVEAAELAHVWSDLGQDWTVVRNYIKPYPVCRWAHAALDALRGLKRIHCFEAEDVERVTIRTFAEAAALVMEAPRTTSEAQYSLGFSAAAVLVHDQVTAAHISGHGLRDARVLALLPRIRAVADARHSDRFPEGRWSDVEVILRDGRVLMSGDVHARGGPEAPMEDSEVEAKFMAMTAELAPERARAIWTMRDRLLEPDTTFSELAALVEAAP